MLAWSRGPADIALFRCHAIVAGFALPGERLFFALPNQAGWAERSKAQQERRNLFLLPEHHSALCFAFSASCFMRSPSWTTPFGLSCGLSVAEGKLRGWLLNVNSGQTSDIPDSL